MYILGLLDRLKRSIEHKIKTGEINVSERRKKFFDRMEKFFEEMEEEMEKDPIFAEIDKITKKTGKPVVVKYTIRDNEKIEVKVSDYFPEIEKFDQMSRFLDEKPTETKKKQGQREEVER